MRGVRTNFFSEVDDGDGPPLPQVDNVNGASVRAGLSDPCVSVDGDIAEAAVRRNSDLVSVDINSHRGQNLSGHRIYEQDAVLHLVRNEKKSVWVLVS